MLHISRLTEKMILHWIANYFAISSEILDSAKSHFNWVMWDSILCVHNEKTRLAYETRLLSFQLCCCAVNRGMENVCLGLSMHRLTFNDRNEIFYLLNYLTVKRAVSTRQWESLFTHVSLGVWTNFQLWQTLGNVSRFYWILCWKHTFLLSVKQNQILIPSSLLNLTNYAWNLFWNDFIQQGTAYKREICKRLPLIILFLRSTRRIKFHFSLGPSVLHNSPRKLRREPRTDRISTPQNKN